MKMRIKITAKPAGWNRCLAALIAFLATALSFVIASTNPAAEVLQKIEVLVNDEVISAYDLQQRLGLVVIATGGVRNQEELLRLREQVLGSMVDEKLQLQEAAEYEVEVSSAEIDDAYFRVSRNFNQTPEDFEAFLIQYGSSRRSLTEQLRAEFAWQTLVRGRLGSQISISDTDVDAAIAQMKANTGKYEFRLAEIYLILDSPSRSEVVRERAERLIKQMEDGAQFSIVARQFSESATAARGGELGWVAEGQMAPEVEAAVRDMELLQVSRPIATPGGFYVLQLLDRRRILSADPLDVQLDITQVIYPFDDDTTQEVVDAWIARAEALTASYSSCDQIDAFVGQMGEGTLKSPVGFISLRDLGPPLAAKLDPLAQGVPSEPIAAQDGIRIFFICDRRQPDIKPPDFDTVYGQLEERRLTMMARRYLRDLRRDAIVDYR